MPTPNAKTKRDHAADQKRFDGLLRRHRALLKQRNQVDEAWSNGVVQRYRNPVLTAKHVPLEWRYDLNPATNPYLMERLGINAVFNAGAIDHEGKFVLVARVEGVDRKSFFALAESNTGIDGFRFIGKPLLLPQTDDQDTHVYDMRLTRHEDGFIYGLFCVERKDPKAPSGDMSSAIAQCGIVRTRDLVKWERLSDLRSDSAQQRNVVLHPQFVDGQYALYTRPQDSFIEAGKGGGIGWALCKNIEKAVIHKESIVDPRVYHTIKEAKNGAGATPIRTPMGWLHIAHGVRNTAAGLRYVLYALLCDLHEPWRVTHRPGGYFMAPVGDERIGDVSNVLFCNGAIARDDGRVFIYYASSDTRLHVATSTIDRLLDYVMHTPEDGLRSHVCVQQRINLIESNLRLSRPVKSTGRSKQRR